MRIIAGRFGSRPIESVPGQNTRPTADKTKGAIFSSLGNYFQGGTFLDCYSGTGNMALEALSRGMEHVTMVDKDRRAIQTIKKNISTLKVKDECSVYQQDIFQILPKLDHFDYVYIDPPYAKQRNLELMSLLEDHVNKNGKVIIESLVEESWPDEIAGFKKYKEKNYRVCKITYYIKEEPSE